MLQAHLSLTSLTRSYAENPKFQKQLTQALESGVPLLVIIGEDELARGEVTNANQPHALCCHACVGQAEGPRCCQRRRHEGQGVDR